MDNLVDMGRAALKGESVARMSATLHESERGIRQGFEDAVPLSIAGLAEQVNSEDRARQLLDGFQRGRYPQLDPGDLGPTVADPGATDRVVNASTPLVGQTFGGRLDHIVDGVASDAGLRRSSVSKLLGLATPLVLGMVGKRALARRLDPRGLLDFLGDQRRFAAGALPAGLAGLLGPTVGSDWERARAPRMVKIPHSQVERPRTWLPWLLGALVLLAVVSWAVLRRAAHQAEMARAPVVTQPVAPSAPRVAVPAPAPEPAIEPAAPAQSAPITEPAAPARSAPITEPAAAAPTFQPMPQSLQAGVGLPALNAALKGTGPLPQNFLLSGLKFRPNSAQLEPSSAGVLIEVGTAMMAHPRATFRIEGHTDSTGTIEDNRRLSAGRANAIKDYLVNQGVDNHRIEAVGVGAERPVADNATPEGRAQNQRTELVITGR
jgi:OOP family OmpA-OmpF porin